MKKQKVAVSLFLSLSIGLSLSACGARAAVEPSAAPLEIAASVAAAQSALPTLTSLTMKDGQFETYLESYYQIEAETVADGAICYAGGVEAGEIAVLVLADEAAAASAAERLADYTESRAGDFSGYIPEQAAMAQAGVVETYGRYAALLICPEPEQARDDFLACFEVDWTPPDTEDVFASLTADRQETPSPTPIPSEPVPTEDPGPPETEQSVEPSPTPEPQPTESVRPSAPVPAPTPAPDSSIQPSPPGDEYDHSAVLAAWQSGDAAALSEKNRAVYDAAAQVIGQVISEGMAPYEQELAIHDYITAHGRYDPEVHSHAPDASPDPDNDNPYGMLVNGVGICRGYSSTFQLFMDLLGIECITVPGSSGGDEHAWNMVRLEGEWYCVDVTWDDPTGGSPGHRYFNVTSQFLRDTNHQWEETGIPEATATTYAWST